MPARLTDFPPRPLGDQGRFDPAQVEAFVNATRVAVLAYARRDGRPAQVPVWYRLVDGQIVVIAHTTSAKVAALRRDPRVCVTIQQEALPYRALMVDGTATLRDLGADRDAERPVAERYLGPRMGANYLKETAAAAERAGLTEISIEPSDVRGFDYGADMNTASRAAARAFGALPPALRGL